MPALISTWRHFSISGGYDDLCMDWGLLDVDTGDKGHPAQPSSASFYVEVSFSVFGHWVGYGFMAVLRTAEVVPHASVPLLIRRRFGRVMRLWRLPTRRRGELCQWSKQLDYRLAAWPFWVAADEMAALKSRNRPEIGSLGNAQDLPPFSVGHDLFFAPLHRGLAIKRNAHFDDSVFAADGSQRGEWNDSKTASQTPHTFCSSPGGITVKLVRVDVQRLLASIHF